MSGRRVSLYHGLAQDMGPESGSPTFARTGQAVMGFATFYVPSAGWHKIPPGRLEIAELLGGAGGEGNHVFNFIATHLSVPEVHFYIFPPDRNNPRRNRSYVAVNGTTADLFTFGFFGTKF